MKQPRKTKPRREVMDDPCGTVYQRKQSEAYCNHIRGLRLRVDAAEASYCEAVNARDGIKGVRYDREGGGSSMTAGDDAIAACLERVTATGDDMIASINEWTGECKQFDMICRRLTPQSSYVLTMRYRNARKWEDIADRMHYTSEYVRKVLRVRALVELYSHLPERWK